MNHIDSHSNLQKSLRKAGYCVACLAGLLGAACGVSYLLDSAKLREIAFRESQNNGHECDKVLALSKWVHDNRGFRENDQSFVSKSMRATPLQVVQSGGDCADKSRLLCALLRQVGIRATMVMCFHRETKLPTHTVVEAQTSDGQFMVVDPVYGLHFPKNEGSGFQSLLDLRADPQILDRRLDQLLVSAPRHSPLRSYNPVSAAYDHASTINWDKNFATRFAHSILNSWYGNEVYRLRRPLILEEPKLFVATVLGLIATFAALVTRIGPSLLPRAIVTPAVMGAASCGR